MDPERRSDEWSRWLLENRFGGDVEFAESYRKGLAQVRDTVLDNAKLVEGAVLLDVGAGDGLITFRALDRVGPTGRLIFAEPSETLLEHSRALAREKGVGNRCTFVQARAEDLRPIASRSVDVLTTRSVLVYISDKAAAFREFRRVLKPGGRISLFEPINRYHALSQAPTRVCGMEIPEVADLVQRLWAFYRQLQPLETDPMMNFDERDLVALVEAADFTDIRLTLHILVRPGPPMKWRVFMNASGNPHIPSLQEAIVRLFTPEEAARYETYVRPVVEGGAGVRREALAFVSAAAPTQAV